MSGRSLAAPPSSTGPRPARGTNRHRALAGGGIAVLVALVLAVGCLHLDKTGVVLAVRGEYAPPRVLEASSGPLSRTSLLEMRNQSGQAVGKAWLRRPRALTPDHRILLVYAGRETGSKILELIPDQPNLVLAAPLYEMETPRRWHDYPLLPWVARRDAFRAVATGMLVVSHLTSAEGLDSERLVVVGASFGVPFATLHTALDPRPQRLFLVHGGGDLPHVFAEMGRRAGTPVLAPVYAGLAWVFLDTFDPLHWIARVAPRPVTLIGARHDRYFPAESIEALYMRAGEPKRLLWTETDHVRSRPSEIVDDILGAIDKVLRELDAAAAAGGAG